MFRFIMANGKTKEIEILGDFYGDEDVAKEKAMSTFVEEAYSKRVISFSTYLTDIRIGEIIFINGRSYKVTSIDIAEDPVKIISRVSGERYEN